MTVAQFAEAMAKIGQDYRGSVTSWGRTDLHAKKVGGFAGDPHTWWLGADMVYDTGFPSITEITLIARSLGLKVIREQGAPHDHFQPLDMPPGPVVAYGGKTRSLA